MLEWNRNQPSQLGQTRKEVLSGLSTIEKISIVGISVSVVSLIWNIHVFNCKKACEAQLRRRR